MTIDSGSIQLIRVAVDNTIHAASNSFVGVEPLQYRAEDLEDSGDATKRYYVPTASGIEGSQYYLDRIAERHCVSGVDWEHVCGSYTPNITAPFALAGHPTNNLSFWEHYYNNIIAMGNNVGRDFSGVLVTNPHNAFTPYNHLNWANYAGTPSSNPDWSGLRYECDGVHAPYPENSFSQWQRPIPSGMHEYGPMMQEDFHTFISAPASAPNPGMFGYATYTRQKSITNLKFDITLDEGPASQSTVAKGRAGTSFEGDDICYNVSGHVGVPITLGYKGNTGFLFHEAGNSKYVYPDTTVTVTGVDLGPDHEALVFYSGLEVIFETQQYHLVGTADFKPLYEWGLFDWGPQGSGLPTASGSTITDFESWTVGGGLYNKNNSSVSDVDYSVFNNGIFYPSDHLHQMSGLWTGPVGSSLFVNDISFNFSTVQRDRFLYYPLEGQNSGEYGFRQLTGIITSGVAEAYGYHLGGRGDYRPDLSTSQQFQNGGWPGAISKHTQNSQDYKTDWSIPQSYCIIPVDMHIHAKVFNDHESILDYLRGRNFDVVDTINFGPIHYGSGEVPQNKIGIFGSDPFITSFAKSGSYSSNFRKTQDISFPVDMFGCAPTGKYIIIGADMPLDSGAIFAATENKDIRYHTINRNRAKIKGQVADIALKHSGAFSYKCNAVETVSNIRTFESNWGDWVYGHAAKSPNNAHGTDTKLIFPDISNGTFVVANSSNPETYFGVSSLKMPIEPLEELYLSGDTTSHFRM